MTGFDFAAEPPAICQSADQQTDALARDSDAAEPDPWEPANRQSYRFSNFVDRHALRPLAMAYRRLPSLLRKGVHNVLSNLDEPMVFVNDAAQLHPANAARSGGRFLINSTIGIGGVFDVADRMGIQRHDNDFGLTLGRYGAPSGPYLFIPLVGPSTIRDAFGDIVEFAIDPIPPDGMRGADTFVAAETTLDALDARVAADQAIADLNTSSIDPYVSLRSIYLQLREGALHGGHTAIENLPDMPEESNAPEPPPPEGEEPPTAVPVSSP